MNINEEVNVYGTQSSIPIAKDVSQKGSKKRYGLRFPMLASSNHGYFVKQSGAELVRSCLIQLLSTEKGERLMMPFYGCGLKRFVSELDDEFLREEIISTITKNIRQYIPLVTLEKIAISDPEESIYGENTIDIFLSVRMKDDINSLIEVQVTL